MSTHSLGPVAAPSRINAIDVARGFALLGILSVNIKFFAEPFGQVMQLTPPEGVGNMFVHAFTKVFCEGKFYPLFSMLFGMGLMLQRGRSEGCAVDGGGRIRVPRRRLRQRTGDACVVVGHLPDRVCGWLLLAGERAVLSRCRSAQAAVL